MLARMSPAQSFVVGVFAGGALLLQIGSSLPGQLLAVPLLGLVAVALFGDGVAGWRGRLARGLVGAVLAGAAGVAAIYYLKSRTDWFDWHDERGGELWLLVLVMLAAYPGTVAAVAARPSRGFALALGFTCGLLSPMLWRWSTNYGPLVLLGLGTAVGTAVGAAVPRRRAL